MIGITLTVNRPVNLHCTYTKMQTQMLITMFTVNGPLQNAFKCENVIQRRSMETMDFILHSQLTPDLDIAKYCAKFLLCELAKLTNRLHCNF